jgi:uncharacterized protein YegL
MANMNLNNDDFLENPTPRVPVCLCLDASGSMSGDPINELNAGVIAFFESVKEDEVARFSAEVSIVSFCGYSPRRELDFDSIERQTPPRLQASGNTPMGAAVTMALDLLDSRKLEYQKAGIDYFQPWLVLMTDGRPTDEIAGAAQRTSKLVEEGKLTIFPIAIGSGADMATLKSFSPKREPLRLQGLNFAAFFEWLSKSVTRVSQSIPGQSIPLDVEGLKGWAEL